MIVSWNWISRYVDTSGIDPIEAARLFTMAVAEIEEVIEPPSIERLSVFPVAEVLSVEKHPKADSLSVCKVRTADEDEVQVVCGAPNVRPGMFSIFAPLGTEVGEFTIERRKLRGVESCGMLMAMDELGVGEDHEGIIELPEGKLGQTAADHFGSTGYTWMLDNKSITHRPDLWGHAGLAREVAALFGRDYRPPAPPKDCGSGNDGFSVSVNDSKASRRYTGLSLGGVTIAPSPAWVRELITEAGMRPINNVVDATNYVMLELGHPTHAFDVRRLPGKNITVDRAQKDQPFETLTGKSLKLDEEALLIKSGGEAVALAGIVGGENSSIADDTTEVFLEAAHFDPFVVRRTASKFDTRTDSSSRFEKSIDPQGTETAIFRIVELLRESCPNLEIRSALVDDYPAPYDKLCITLSPETVRKKLGSPVDDGTQRKILTGLGFKLNDRDGEWDVEVPSWRNTKDIESAIDLVEEIGRVFGYDNIAPTSPMLDLRTVENSTSHARDRLIREVLSARGVDEVMTYSFSNPGHMARAQIKPEQAMEIENPVGREFSHLRPSLLPHALDVWALNAKNFHSFACYELGVTFHNVGEKLPRERNDLICARYAFDKSDDVFYRLQADLRALFDRLSVPLALHATAEAPKAAHPARVAAISSGGTRVGTLAKLHPAEAKKAGMRGRLAFFLVEDVVALKATTRDRFVPIGRFPPVPFTLSLVVPDRTTVAEVGECLSGVDPIQIRDLRWTGTFRGAPIEEGKASMTFSMEFRNAEKTFTANEITDLQNRLVAAAAKRGFVLRDA